MDRLFLRGLVREIEARVRGCRIKDARLQPSTRTLSLGLGMPQRPRLVLRLDAASALYLGPSDSVGGVAAEREKKLTRLLGGAMIEAIRAEPLDRVVTFRLVQTRVSGRKRELSLVLELLGTQRSAFLVSEDTGLVIDSFGAADSSERVGRARPERSPPPNAASEARSVSELEQRLDALPDGLEHETLLRATGWTPLLVRELRYLVESCELSLGAAFEEIAARLERASPVLYVEGRKSTLSPIELGHIDGAYARACEGFNDAMLQAAHHTDQLRRIEAGRGRLANALSRRLKSHRSLQKKLRSQLEGLDEPEHLRVRAETLLAGLTSVTRVSADLVRLPDAFDPEGRLIELSVDPRFDLRTNAERWFRRSRKIERSKLEIGRRLESLDQQVHFVEGFVFALEDAHELVVIEDLVEQAERASLLQPLRDRGASRTIERALPRVYESRRGNRILVGRSARSNEEVTFRHAQPEDLWFHAAGRAGSHVALRRLVPGPFDDGEIVEAAELAAYFSKARRESLVDVQYTERRHVSKIKGAPPGLVKVDRIRVVRVAPRARAEKS